MNHDTMTCPPFHLRSYRPLIHPRPPLQNTHLYSGDNYSEERERERERKREASLVSGFCPLSPFAATNNASVRPSVRLNDEQTVLCGCRAILYSGHQFGLIVGLLRSKKSTSPPSINHACSYTIYVLRESLSLSLSPSFRLTSMRYSSL